ncbi:MAG: sigma 54-interacting transcriptional regulator [Acidobacteriota bacterium]|nr:sigma 54-interacting transcriptional regulator [Acidobacteriota bacterium]
MPETKAIVDVRSHRRARRADRRPGLHALVRHAASELVGVRTLSDVTAAMSAALASVAHVRRARLTDGALGAGVRVGHPVLANDYAAFAVPAGPDGRHLLLEVAFDPQARPDEWTLQLLESAASLAAVVLGSERGSLRPAALSSSDDVGPLIGSSEVMQALRDRIERVAATDFTILIEGESGVGKELVARQLHACSRRRHGPFVAINCAALVETLLEAELFGIEERTATGVRGRRGKFEHADGGTLFLDEVSDLSMSAQAKLLRAIQDLTVERVGGVGGRRVDLRIVAATNRSLSGLVAHGLFRADLFYRLSGVEVLVPPLRLRKADILELAQYFLARHQTRGRHTMTPAAVDALLAYDWPGNVRELERMMEGAIATAESRHIRLDDLPASLRGDYAHVLVPSVMEDHSMRAWGSRYARLVLDRCHGNKRQACQRLSISYHTLNAYLRYGSGPRVPVDGMRRSLTAAPPPRRTAPGGPILDSVEPA